MEFIVQDVLGCQLQLVDKCGANETVIEELREKEENFAIVGMSLGMGVFRSDGRETGRHRHFPEPPNDDDEGQLWDSLDMAWMMCAKATWEVEQYPPTKLCVDDLCQSCMESEFKRLPVEGVKEEGTLVCTSELARKVVI